MNGDGERGVLVYCPIQNNTPLAVGAQALCAGRDMADLLGEPLWAAALGAGARQAAARLAEYPVDGVLYGGDSRPGAFLAPDCAAVLAAMARRQNPRVLILPATDEGRDVAARTAALLGVGLTADCTRLEMERESGLMLQSRPAFDGHVTATIYCRFGRPQMATLRPGVYPPLPFGGAGAPITRVPGPAPAPSPFAVHGEEALPLDDALLGADIVVAAGRGVRSAAGLALVEGLAAAAGGVVGGSRAAVEEGLLPYSRQIGQTGKTVRPRLYVACGISGSAHHMAGVRAGAVLAVNRDPEAPIFKSADYGVCGDLFAVLPKLAKLLGGHVPPA